jgi:hypothetical protein
MNIHFNWNKIINIIMGFHKRFINKDMILRNVDDISYISSLVSADALIMDNWSRNFFNNFNLKWKEYNSLRDKLNEDVQFYSFHEPTLEHDNYSKLKNLSNVLVNLKIDPSWTDILLTHDILKEMDVKFTEKTPDNIIGKFDKLVPYHIELIERYYDN